jgi:signal transduction histidine kinase
MLSLISFTSLILTFAICAGLSFFLWPARRSPLHKLVLISQLSYTLWAFLVIMIASADDLSHKIFFSQARLLFLPALAPTWVLIAVGIFNRSLWDKWGPKRNLIFVIPGLVILGQACVVFGFPFASEWTFYNFMPGDGNFGLLKYQTGWLMHIGFLYTYTCLLALYVLYTWVIFTKGGVKRKYAIIMAAAGLANIFMQLGGRFYFKIPEMQQLSVAAVWPAAIALYFSVTKLEFLDIGALAYEKVFESLPSPVLIFDSKENFWNANKAAFEVFGLKDAMKGELGQNLSVLAPVFSKNEFIEIQQKNYQVVRHNLQIKGGEESAQVYVLNDVTDLQERNETLRDLNDQVLKMMKFNHKINAVLSHDLTGSLVGVRMLLSGMKKRFDQRQDLASSEALEKLVSSNDSSIKLLRDVLVWSQEGESSLWADLKVCLEEALFHITSQMHAKNIQIETQIPDRPILLKGSSKVIESVFRNLISNAIKFSPPEGIVRVEVSACDRQVKICFVDEGSGIPEEKIALIMAGKPYQADNQTGFGMGLRFTLSFVEQLGGKIQIESNVGKGARFTLSLPLI